MIHSPTDIPSLLSAIWYDGHWPKAIRQWCDCGQRTKAGRNQLLSSEKRNTKKEMKISKGRVSHDACFSQMQMWAKVPQPCLNSTSSLHVCRIGKGWMRTKKEHQDPEDQAMSWNRSQRALLLICIISKMGTTLFGLPKSLLYSASHLFHSMTLTYKTLHMKVKPPWTPPTRSAQSGEERRHIHAK